MLLKDLQNIFHKELDAIYGKDEVDSFFFLCTEHYLDLPRFQLTLQPEFSIVKSETDTFFKVLEDLKQQKPIQLEMEDTSSWISCLIHIIYSNIYNKSRVPTLLKVILIVKE